MCKDRNRLLKFLLCAALLMMSLAGLSALAEGEATPSPMPTTVPVTDGHIIFPLYCTGDASQMYAVKSGLISKGYLDSNALNGVAPEFLDLATLTAVNAAAQKNELKSDYTGIVDETWAVLLQGNYLGKDEQKAVAETPAPTAAAATPTPDPYPHISWGGTGLNVENVVTRLSALGYYSEENRASFVYDDSLKNAIDRMCEINVIDYDQNASNGITPELQRRIVEDQNLKPNVVATATPEPTEVPLSTSDKIIKYFTDKSPLLGLGLPMWAIWLICLVIVAGIGFAVIRLFGGNGDGEGRINFEISYMGQTKKYRSNIDHSLKIGRNIGSFPLFPEDKSISRKHCELYFIDDRLMVRDYSTGGTYVNGRNCSKGEYELHSGDEMRIGSHEIKITF